MPFALRELGKILISFEAWNKCALGQVVFRDRFSHSRKCLIGVVLFLESSILSSLTALSEPTVFEQLNRRNAFFS